MRIGELMIATTKAGGGWLPVSTEEGEGFWGDFLAFIADTCLACGVGNRIAHQDPEALGQLVVWEGELAADPVRRATLARGYAVQVFKDSVVVLGERHIRESDVADWFGVRRPATDRTIQIAEATRFGLRGMARTVLILDALLPSRLVLPYGGRDHQLERLAIECEATATGPVADAFIDPPVEVGIYGRSIAVTWATPGGPFPVWTSTEGARWLCRARTKLRGVVAEPHDWARAACLSLGVSLTDRHLDLTPLLPGVAGVGVDLSSHLDPGEEATHRWAIRPY